MRGLSKTAFICAMAGLVCGRVLMISAEAATDTSLIDLGAVVITPSRIIQSMSSTTQQVSVVDAKTMETSGVQEAAQALELLPSVDVLEYGALGAFKGVLIRGANASQVLALIDGRPMYTPRDGLADFTNIPVSQIERIEVLRGPASSMYGANAVGGVVNIITKQGTEKMRTELMTRTGSYSTNQIAFSHGHKVGGFDYFLTYDYAASHGHRVNSAYLRHAASVKLGYQLNQENHVGLSGNFTTAELGTPGITSFEDTDDRQDSWRKDVHLTWRGKFMEGQDILINAFHTTDRLEFHETFEPSSKNTHQTKIHGFDAQVSQTLFSVFRTAVGASFQDHGLNSSNSNKHGYDFKAVYVETEVDVTKKLTAKTGLRWDDYSHFGDRVSPSASMSLWLFEGVKLHALAARSFRAPTFNDLYWPREDWGMWGGVEGNPALGPEKATSFEAGISGDFFKGRLSADLTAFKTKYQSLIEWNVDNAWWWRPENVSSATTKGVEAEVRYRFSGPARAAFSYLYLEAVNTATKKWLIYRPRHTYKISFTGNIHPRWEAGIVAAYKTKRFSNQENTAYLKHFATMDLTMTYLCSEQARLFFEIKNLFDRQYQEEREYPLPGRTFYAGMRLRF